MNRPLCTICKGNLAAINYRAGDKVRYRKTCAACARKGKYTQKQSGWVKAGYKKKLVCERCGFKSKNASQMFVFHLDGNLKHNDWSNLKSVCANCRIEVNGSKTTWRESPLTPDF